jgi:hypothetical protein
VTGTTPNSTDAEFLTLQSSQVDNVDGSGREFEAPDTGELSISAKEIAHRG